MGCLGCRFLGSPRGTREFIDQQRSAIGTHGGLHTEPTVAERASIKVNDERHASRYDAPAKEIRLEAGRTLMVL
ncbi:hypothetical protein ZHAS_00009902 [Anopheles sinensis]|uniref:Uncharacterized protein n=1 Tax=Anopheles sinensis TaxID=74873 RepID=A0A084VW56_ANOSI|nr:hypothetical protein ZHAS_00009902 [Anopheles sinensis]